MLQFQKIILLTLGIAGFVVNLIGSLTYFMYGYAYAWTVDELWKYPNNISIMLWDPNFTPLVEHVKVLSSDFLLTAHLINDSYLRWGLSPCLFDVYLYCQYGIFSILLLSIIIAIIAVIIIKYSRTKKKIFYKDE